MRPNQQNSFSGSGYARQESSRHHHQYRQGMTHERSGYPVITLSWLLRKLAVLTERLYILAKYQFYKRTAVAPSRINVPVLKLGVVAVLAFFVFRKDAAFSVGMDAADEHFSTGGEAKDVALRSHDEPKSSWSLFSVFEEEDPFADDPADDEETRRTKAYIRRYKDVAIEEHKQYGIPASIKMAQGIVESNAGASALSKKTNNHFGIKCFSRTCKKGHCSNFGDDSHKDFFRKYGSAWESWREHSRMIMNGKYKSLKKYGTDYKSWAHGLKKLGYATAPKYDYTLIERIEKYKLYKLDEE
ncbi:MAG: glucosaminidase domain-containing protein [Bacteroidota bacterium]